MTDAPPDAPSPIDPSAESAGPTETAEIAETGETAEPRPPVDLAAKARREALVAADLNVLYRDRHFIVIDKPSGLLVHRSHIARDVRQVALQLVRRIARRRVHAVHRLDRGTSGVLLFALDPESARDAADLFAARRVDKTYYAVVRGHPEAGGVIDHPINNSKHGERKEAITHYRTVAVVHVPVAMGKFPSQRYALVEMKPHTGRRHQLRRHACHIHHPIIGDTTHGDGRHNRLYRVRYRAHRLLLYAARLRFTHPYTGEELDLRCPPDPTLSALCARFGWPDPLAGPLPEGEAIPVTTDAEEESA